MRWKWRAAEEDYYERRLMGKEVVGRRAGVLYLYKAILAD